MADARYTCAHCNVQMENKAGKGRPRKFCSSKCNSDYHRILGGVTPIEIHRAQRKERARLTCEQCGSGFIQNGKTSKNGQPRKARFCSNDCCLRFKGKMRKISDEARVSFTVILNKNQSTVSWRDGYQPILNANCRNCGNDYIRSNAGSTRFMCSQQCANEAAASAKRAGRLKRKALERGARVGVSIDPLRVFMRDGWKCQLCGTSTPKSKRGTYEDKAPELDHILPISLGGKHDWSNVHCSCRKCNLDKGARPKGQMLLFPEA